MAVMSNVDAVRLPKFTGSEVGRKSGNILETVQHNDVVTADHEEVILWSIE